VTTGVMRLYQSLDLNEYKQTDFYLDGSGSCSQCSPDSVDVSQLLIIKGPLLFPDPIHPKMIFEALNAGFRI
jgi:hypothetical protein